MILIRLRPRSEEQRQDHAAQRAGLVSVSCELPGPGSVTVGTFTGLVLSGLYMHDVVKTAVTRQRTAARSPLRFLALLSSLYTLQCGT